MKSDIQIILNGSHQRLVNDDDYDDIPAGSIYMIKNT
jgi:hypothetical protein